jgi:flagellar basal-body rod protein FlgF
MNYGLYLSATGVQTSSYRQDVIANNIANAETVGFKKDLALFQQRPTEAQARGSTESTNPLLEGIGGGLFAAPTQIDTGQGDLESTGNAFDLGIQGSGFFKVNDSGASRLTRDGRMMVDRTGQLVMANSKGQPVLDVEGRPIKLDPNRAAADTIIDTQGQIKQGGRIVARIGLFEVADRAQLHKVGGNLISYPESTALLPAHAEIRSGFTERSNVEPANELTQLMDSQRQLEANASMIRFQDQMLARLVNDVGKIT